MNRESKIKFISTLAGFIACFLMMYFLFDESASKSVFGSLSAVAGIFIADLIFSFFRKMKNVEKVQVSDTTMMTEEHNAGNIKNYKQ